MVQEGHVAPSEVAHGVEAHGAPDGEDHVALGQAGHVFLGGVAHGAPNEVDSVALGQTGHVGLGGVDCVFLGEVGHDVETHVARYGVDHVVLGHVALGEVGHGVDACGALDGVTHAAQGEAGHVAQDGVDVVLGQVGHVPLRGVVHVALGEVGHGVETHGARDGVGHVVLGQVGHVNLGEVGYGVEEAHGVSDGVDHMALGEVGHGVDAHGPRNGVHHASSPFLLCLFCFFALILGTTADQREPVWCVYIEICRLVVFQPKSLLTTVQGFLRTNSTVFLILEVKILCRP